MAHRKKQLVLMNTQLEEEMRLEREADEEKLVREGSLSEYEGSDDEDEDEEV